MSNMSYCRFRNTLSDLRDCYYQLSEPEWNEETGEPDKLSEEETRAASSLVDLCRKIADMFPSGYISPENDYGDTYVGMALAGELAEEEIADLPETTLREINTIIQGKRYVIDDGEGGTAIATLKQSMLGGTPCIIQCDDDGNGLAPLPYKTLLEAHLDFIE